MLENYKESKDKPSCLLVKVTSGVYYQFLKINNAYGSASIGNIKLLKRQYTFNPIRYYIGSNRCEIL